MRLLACILLPLVSCSYGSGTPGHRLPDLVREAFQHADAIQLYSLNPERRTHEEKEENPDEPLFHGWRILGVASFDENGTKESILLALDAGLGSWNKERARCFNPRHGLRVTHKGRNFDLVICYECHTFYAYDGGGNAHEGSKAIGSPGSDTLNGLLEAANIPLAK